jgi:hypothetical protein
MWDWLSNEGWQWLLFNVGVGLFWLVVVAGIAAALFRRRVVRAPHHVAHERSRTR